jgi:hypothetical protein
LVVNPDSGLSKWVYLEHLPPGASRNAVPAPGETPAKAVQPGVAVAVASNPFAAIYVASDATDRVQASGSGIRDAMADAVSASEQLAINTAVALTKKTYFVQLDPSVFPSYEGSMDIEIANENYQALSNYPGLGWPPSGLAKADFDALLKVLGLYTGHAFTVCDVFGNGDSACFEPDPFDKDVLTQSGTAHDVKGSPLNDIANRVAGGGSGIEVQQDPPNVEYFLPPAGGGSGVRCGFVDGVLGGCILVE